MKPKAFAIIAVAVVSFIAGAATFSSKPASKTMPVSAVYNTATPYRAKVTATIKTSATATPKTPVKTYVLNKNTKKFHVPSCSSVKQMYESNKIIYTGTRKEVIDMGYDPCQRCNP